MAFFDNVEKTGQSSSAPKANAVATGGLNLPKNVTPRGKLRGKEVYFIVDPSKAPPPDVAKANLTSADLKTLLFEMVESRASDLHLTVGIPPCVRVDGDVYKMYQYSKLTPDKVQSLVYSVLKDKQKKDFEQSNELDFSFGIQKLSRFRANIFKQRGAIATAIRQIPYTILDFDQLGLPSAVRSFVDVPKGLVLVTGPTGSGKSTTLASMINYINRNKPLHIITIEDPIEYTHQHQRSIINQRQIGEDSESFPTALKYVLREDPDVIMIGEMRDLETIGAAITIAETGHLVFATLHTNSTIESINRMIDVFPAHQQSQVRTQLAFVLQGIMTQQLIPRMGRSGRALIAEILVPTPAIRAMIREDKLHQVYSALQVGKKYEMQTMNEAFAVAVKKGLISKKDAMTRTMNKEELVELYKHYGIR
ncbi:type IV pilus twitching motility protein PilT [bacterium]|nr:type IV pilus twitching motility protein PilT [bacterium]